MSMRTASSNRSPCELVRKINDLCQEDNDKDNEIRKLCAETEKKAKMLARELRAREKELKRPPRAWGKEWGENPQWQTELENRLRDDYLQEGSKGEIGKL